MFTLHAAFCILFVGASALLIGLSALPGLSQAYFLPAAGVLIICSTCFAWRARRYGVICRSLAADNLLWSITLSGIPGLILYIPESPLLVLAFVWCMILRNYLLFILLPRTVVSDRHQAWRHALLWVYIASLLVILTGMHTAHITETSLTTGSRLVGEGNGWINSNSAGLLSSFGILVAFLCPFIPSPVRIASLLLGGYVLILVESRTSILALFTSLGAYTLIRSASRRKFIPAIVSLALLVVVAASFHFSSHWFDAVASHGRIASISARTTGQGYGASDGIGGRRTVFIQAFESFLDSPIFGHGYMSPESRFENGYLSILVESGILGLLLQLIFTYRVLIASWFLYRHVNNIHIKSLGIATVCTTIFIITHALGERTHGFQLASAVSNIWLLLAGYANVYYSLLNRRIVSYDINTNRVKIVSKHCV